MRTFAQKPNATPQTTSGKSAIPGLGHFEQSPEVTPTPHLQRMIGNEAMQRLEQVTPDDREAVSDATAFDCVGRDFSQIPVRAKASINTPGKIYQKEVGHV